MSRAAPLRIGYITQDFPPEVGAGPARVTEMALRWQAAGALVTVVTGMPNRRLPGLPDGAIHPDYRGRLFSEETWQGLRVLRSWMYASPRRGFATTLLNNTTWMATGAAHALLRAGTFDVMIASSPPFFVHLAGEMVRKARRTPMVLEIRDLWPDYMVEMGVLKNRTAQKALFGLERSLLRRGQHAVVVTESFRRRVIEKGMRPEQVDVISNGVDTDFYYRDAAAEAALPALRRRSEREFVVGYLGNFGAGQEIRTVVEAAKRLEAELPDVRFVLAGDGTAKPQVEQRAAELGVRNLTIHPPIEKVETRAFYNACDLCLVPLAPIPIFSETVPSKIFEVMACERPVLASVAGEAARIVDGSQGGIVSTPGDAAEMAAAVRRASEMSAAARAAMGQRGRAFVAEHYSRAALADRYLGILQRVAGRPA
jgi:glycosyltransferase involved in cell wall biosynthesis